MSIKRPTVVQMAVAVCCGVFAALAVGFRAGAELPEVRGVPATPVIAVIDLSRLIDQLYERSAAEADLKSEQSKKQSSLDGLKKEIDEETEKYKILADGEEKRKMYEAIRRKTFEWEFNRQFGEAELAEKRGQFFKDLYAKIAGSVQRVAEKNGYTMVITSDEELDLDGVRLDEIQRVMTLRRCIYVDDRHDITADVALDMNNDFTAKGGKAPAAAAPAPAATKGEKKK